MNPGLLISIPFPIVVPELNLDLPIKLEPIIVNRLELSSIYVKEVDYSWTFTQKEVKVQISDIKIMFQWSYKEDKGQGIFSETSYMINLTYKVTQNNKDRLLL